PHLAGTGSMRRCLALTPGLLHEPRHRVDEMHLISPLGQPEGVGTGRAADIENGRRWRWQIAKHYLLPARDLPPRGSRGKASLLRYFIVVAGDLFGELRRWWLFHLRIAPGHSSPGHIPSSTPGPGGRPQLDRGQKSRRLPDLGGLLEGVGQSQ